MALNPGVKWNQKTSPIPTVPMTMQLVNADGTLTRSGQILLQQVQASEVMYGTSTQRPDPGTVPDGALYVESDRNYVIYASVAGVWHYAAGTMWGTMNPDLRPADLGPADGGFQYRSTDEPPQFWIWSGSEWINDTLVLYGTHAARPPADEKTPPGTIYVETDRGGVIYQQQANAWHYLAGTMWGTMVPDQRPTDLGATDAGFLYRSTDSPPRSFIWSGSVWAETTDPWAPVTGGIAYTAGKVGIGNGSSPPQATLNVNNTGTNVASPHVTALLIQDQGSNWPIVSVEYSGSTSASPGQVFFQYSARGTAALPSAVQSGDLIGGLRSGGYGATGFGGRRANLQFWAAENWGDTNQGVYLTLETTAIGTASPVERLRIDPSGNVGIGTGTPQGLLHLSQAGGILLLDNGMSIQQKNVAGAAVNLLTHFSDDNVYLDNANGSIFLRPSGGTITVATGGKIGIGISPSYFLQLSTDSAAKPSTNTWTIASDIRCKRNVSRFDGDIEVIRRLDPIVGEYNGKGGTPEGQRVVSFDAAKLREILPQAVIGHRAKLHPDDAEETELLGVNTHEIFYHMLRAIQRLDREVEAFKRKAR